MSTPAAVITCSDTATAAPQRDRSGPAAASLLTALGFTVIDQRIVPDEIDQIAASVRKAIAAGARVVTLSGGTGIGPRDVTPEAVASLGGRALPGFGEAMRAAARDRVPQADLSRGGAVAVGPAVVLMLPGSTGGVRDGLAVAGPLLTHAIAMLEGRRHPEPRPPATAAEGGTPPPLVEPVARGAEAKPHLEVAPNVRESAPTLREPQDGGRPPSKASSASGRGDGTSASEQASPNGRPSYQLTGEAAALVGGAVIDAQAVTARLAHPAAGAVVSFEGRVRDHDHDRQVRSLTYEAHPQAGHVLAEVVAKGVALPGVIAAEGRHRVGELTIGDLAFFVAVSAAHRAEAFAACSWIVDEAKASLPIWKRQVFADGTTEWVNSP